MPKNSTETQLNTKDFNKIKALFVFFSISFLLFGSTMMMSYAQPQQKVTPQGKQLSAQLQQQLQQQKQLIPQLQQQLQKQPAQRPQQQEEQQELKYELQKLQQQQPQAATTGKEGEEGEEEKEDDVPSLNDIWKIQPQTLPGSPLIAQVPGPTTLGSTTGLNQTSTTGIQAPQVQATINTSSPPTVLLNPPPNSGPLPDNQAPIGRGCFPGIGADLPTAPQWVTVKPSPYDTVVAQGVITPSRYIISHHEWPFNHKSHDNAFHVKLDKQYTGLASKNHPTDPPFSNFGQRIMEMEWEIGTDNSGKTDRFPTFFWPWVGDRVWMMGHWVWDCGHFNPTSLNGWLSEIHAPFATAFTRNESTIFPGETRPSSATMTYIYIHGQGGYYNTPVGGRNYEFDIPTLPKPHLSTLLKSKVTCCIGVSGPAPIVTPKSQLCDFGGTMTPCAHVVIPLSGIPASTGLKYGAAVAVKWIDPTLAFQPTGGFRTLRVTFDSIKVNEDHDESSGEWNKLWVGVNGKWIELSGPSGHYGLNDVDNGQVIVFPPRSKSVTVIVPEKGELKIQTTGWEDDNDGYYGHGYLWYLALPEWSPIGPSKLGALNDNDYIGVLSHNYCSTEGRCEGGANFGIGPHNDPSNLAAGDSGTGDFNLRYRIEQVSITPPTQPPAAPKLPTQPPVLK